MASFNVADVVLASLVAVSTLPVYALLRFILSTLRPPNYPPGPPIIPGLGNIHQIPLSKSFLQFDRWSKTYGDILGLKIGPNNLVVLHNPKHVREVFETKGAHSSERPHMYIPCEHVFPGDWGRQVSFQSMETQRRMRTATRYHLGTGGMQEILPLHKAMASKLMHDLLTKPDDFLESFRRWTLATPLPMISGQRVEDLGPGWVEKFHETQEMWAELLEPGRAPPVDVFPILSWLPESLAGWKRKAKIVRKNILEEYLALLETVKERRHSAKADGKFECLIARMLREQEGKPEHDRLSERDIAFIGGGLLEGAADTTMGTSLFMIQVLAAYPEVRKRAQEEVDREWGVDTIPEHIDTAKLPYLHACLMEVLRWRPVVSQIPRRCSTDIELQGYRIPKDTTVIHNVWKTHHSADDYDRPDAFDPDRYLRNPLGKKNSAGTEGRHATYAFGTGRRACPGEQFALNSLEIAFAQLLWAFDVTPVGELDMSVETGFHSALILAPNSFKVKILPRDEARRLAVVDKHLWSERFLKEVLCD